VKDRPLITLNNISVRLYDRLYLRNTSWEIRANENWAIVGPNGSGKTTLAKALFRRVPVVRGSVVHHVSNSNGDGNTLELLPVGYASPELFREIFERELLEESFRDFSGRIDEKTTPRDIVARGMDKNETDSIAFENRLLHLADKMGIRRILDRDICGVSSGELCKVIIVRALMGKPKLLILDEPFNGLDGRSRKSLMENLNDLLESGVRLILITHRFEEILPGISHVLHINNGEICSAGKKEAVLCSTGMTNGVKQKNRSLPFVKLPDLPSSQQGRASEPEVGFLQNAPSLIDMHHVTVRYGDTVVLDDFSWCVKAGENWLILGENGAGKSTVLKLIIGDNPQVYSNHVHVLGRKRGVGTSIWEVKKKIGLVSTEFQARYPKDVPVFKVVCSGFYDSMGLYRPCSKDQRNTAMEWITTLGIEDLVDYPFGRLSYGQRKLTLIARALVKAPTLLFLDEPCDGLDKANRQKILDMIEYIGRHTHTRLVYVTHHEDEILPCITHRLILRQGKILESGKIC